MKVLMKSSSLCAIFVLLLLIQAGGDSGSSLSYTEQLTIIKVQDQIILNHIEQQIQLRDSTLKIEAQQKQDSILYGSTRIQHSEDSTR